MVAHRGSLVSLEALDSQEVKVPVEIQDSQAALATQGSREDKVDQGDQETMERLDQRGRLVFRASEEGREVLEALALLASVEEVDPPEDQGGQEDRVIRGQQGPRDLQDFQAQGVDQGDQALWDVRVTREGLGLEFPEALEVRELLVCLA